MFAEARNKIGQLKLPKGKPGGLYKDGEHVLTKQDLFEGEIKYIPYTRHPRIEGVSNNMECRVDATLLRIFDTHDAIDLNLNAQLQAIFISFDVYSDAIFLWSLLTSDTYKAVTQWKKDIFLLLFLCAQILWLLAGLVLTVIIGRKLIRCHKPFSRFLVFCKLWVAMLLNAPLISLLQVVSFGTMHFQIDAHYGAVFVATRELRESKTEGAVGFIPQTITLILEDLGLLFMNLLITAEIGFTPESTVAMIFGVTCVGMKAHEIFSFWRLGLSEEKALLSKHQWTAEEAEANSLQDDNHLAQSVGAVAAHVEATAANMALSAKTGFDGYSYNGTPAARVEATATRLGQSAKAGFDCYGYNGYNESTDGMAEERSARGDWADDEEDQYTHPPQKSLAKKENTSDDSSDEAPARPRGRQPTTKAGSEDSTDGRLTETAYKQRRKNRERAGGQAGGNRGVAIAENSSDTKRGQARKQGRGGKIMF